MSSHDDLVPTADDGQAALLDRASAPAAPFALPQLAVSALMVTKADLLAALRAYLPHLSDIEAIDGDRFLLVVGPHDGAPAENGAH
jgi:hypothetical protein